MGLYLAVFNGSVELDGVEVGSYADFNRFRDAVTSVLEKGAAGMRFPTLLLHSDCDGSWSPTDCGKLVLELDIIKRELEQFPPFRLDGWQKEVADSRGLKVSSLRDCFFDVDGEPLITRMQGLSQLSVRKGLPVIFQ